MNYLLICLISWGLVSEMAVAKEQTDWNVADYFHNLPNKYINFFGDAISSEQRASMYQIVDIPNGYIALYEHKTAKWPWLVLTIFRSPTHGTLVAVTNRHYDFVCFWYDSFFLKKEGNQWRDVSAEVLPKLSPKLFYQNQKLAQYLIEYPSETTFSYHFRLPQQGTTITLALEVCDYIDISPPLPDEEVSKLLQPDFSFKLKWDKNRGKFLLLK